MFPQLYEKCNKKEKRKKGEYSNVYKDNLQSPFITKKKKLIEQNKIQ